MGNNHRTTSSQGSPLPGTSPARLYNRRASTLRSMETASSLPNTAVLICGGALATTAVYVALNDPAAAGSRFPACLFHQATGLWCPGCGLTRGVHALLRGDVAAAVSSNIFTPVVVLAVIWAWAAWLRRSWGRPVRWRIAAIAPSWTGPALITLAVVYGVVRNIPWSPFRSLAP